MVTFPGDICYQLYMENVEANISWISIVLKKKWNDRKSDRKRKRERESGVQKMCLNVAINKYDHKFVYNY